MLAKLEVKMARRTNWQMDSNRKLTRKMKRLSSSSWSNLC